MCRNLNRILQSSRLSRGVMWFKTDVSGLPIGPIIKNETVKEEGQFHPLRLDSLTFQDLTVKWSRNVRYKPPYAA